MQQGIHKLIALSTVVWVASMCSGQSCELQVTTTGSGATFSGPLYGLTSWDPDGTGPLPARIVAGGRFTNVAAATINRIAMWEPSTGYWQQMGAGFNNQCEDLLALPTGELISCGWHATSGGVPIGPVARWSDTGWEPLGARLLGSGYGLGRGPDGSVYAVGGFSGRTDAGPISNVMRWDGTNWHALGGGFDSIVRAIDFLPDGRVIVGGRFTQVSGVPANRVAVWNGSNWAPLSSTNSLGSNQFDVTAVQVLPNGNVFVGGSFINPGVVQFAALWNGTSFVQVSHAGGQSLSEVVDAKVSTSGTLMVAMGNGLYQLNGTQLQSPTSPFIASANRVNSVHPNADGSWLFSRDDSIGRIWGNLVGDATGGISTIGQVSGDPLADAKLGPDGAMYVVGRFGAANQLPAGGVARWDTSRTWAPLGVCSPVDGSARTLVWLADGRLMVAGQRGQIGAIANTYAAIFDGTTWMRAETGLSSDVWKLVTLADGRTVAGTQTQGLRMWNGTAWVSTLNLSQGEVRAIDELSNGDLVVLGNVTVPVSGSASVALYSGGVWTKLRGAERQPLALDVSDDNRVRVATTTTVEELSGLSWTTIGTWQQIMGMASIANGDVVVCGVLGPANLRVARFDGTQWNAVVNNLFVPTRMMAADENTLVLSMNYPAPNGVPAGLPILDFTCSTRCDGIDFNRNFVFPEDQDVIDFFSVLAGAACPYLGECDIDFNNNSVFPEDQDVIDFFTVLAGGLC